MSYPDWSKAILEFDFQINDKLNSNYISTLITIVASIFAIAMPLSIQLVSSSVNPAFSNKELAEVVYSHPKFKWMKANAVILAILASCSWLDIVSTLIGFFLLVASLSSLIIFWQFLKVIQEVTSDFTGMVLKSNQEAIDELLS